MRLFHKIIGHGPTLVMVHGNGEDHSIFNEAVSKLKDYFTLVLIDSLGHGQSEKVEHYSYQVMCDALHHHLQTIQITKPFYFYGFSDGGIIGLLYLLQYPAEIKQAVLSGVNIHPSGLKEADYQAISDAHSRKPRPLLELMLTQPDISTQQLNMINNKVHLLFGENDCIKEDHIREIHHHIGNSELLILKNHTHSSYVYSSELADILIKILTKEAVE